jgi:uncharacterized protein (UPF0262 family)
MTAACPDQRLIAIHLDEASIGRGNPDQEHERRVALLNRKLALDIRTADDQPIVTHLLSLTPFRSILRDYFSLCETYYAAIRTATPSQIEAIDMGRRGLHDEAAELLAARLKGKVTADFDTMRRLFTLLTALHWKG